MGSSWDVQMGDPAHSPSVSLTSPSSLLYQNELSVSLERVQDHVLDGGSPKESSEDAQAEVLYTLPYPILSYPTLSYPILSYPTLP